MSLEALLGFALLVSVYVLVYFRLMVRFHHGRVNPKKERSLLAVLSVPPYRNLDERGKRYARRWWYTLLVMTSIIGVLATQVDFGNRRAAAPVAATATSAMPTVDAAAHPAGTKSAR